MSVEESLGLVKYKEKRRCGWKQCAHSSHDSSIVRGLPVGTIASEEPKEHSLNARGVIFSVWRGVPSVCQ